MKRLTVAGRLFITALILGAIFLGYKYLGGQKMMDQMAKDQAQTPQTEATAEGDSVAPETGTDTEATDTNVKAFSYPPPRSGGR